MEKIWTEAMIRAEMARLDTITGLKGASLPISFGNTRRELGRFSLVAGGSFRFSNVFFQDPQWPKEYALNTIRHEYAHYMDYMLYGKMGHGRTWKECCKRIEAVPERIYNPNSQALQEKKHQVSEEEKAQLTKSLDKYTIGRYIEHPLYGEGMIVKLNGDGDKRSAIILFRKAGGKEMPLFWLAKNCPLVG